MSKIFVYLVIAVGACVCAAYAFILKKSGQNPVTRSACVQIQYVDPVTKKKNTGYATLLVKSDTLVRFEVPDQDGTGHIPLQSFWTNKDFVSPVLIKDDDKNDINLILKNGRQFNCKLIWGHNGCEPAVKMDSVAAHHENDDF